MSDLGNKEVFAKNLKYYMNYYNKDRNQVCDDLQIPYTTFTDWYNGVTYPRIDKIELLADYFDIKKSDLIEDKYREQNPSKTDILYNKTKDILSDDDRATIESIMTRTIEKYEQNKNQEE